uniref:Uncharacterized protein n=1 Tax=Biomphalaria glabrata TaxID=6526 RepID=A0A2C9KUN4_BIOGL
MMCLPDVADDGALGTIQHECLSSEGGESDLQNYLAVCEKNPNHKGFISVKDFTVHHLPEGHRHHDLYEFIKATADLTVRVGVKMTSLKRPDVWPDKTGPYPFFELKGKTTFRCGSGELDIYEYKNGYGRDGHGHTEKAGFSYNSRYPTCPCDNCLHSDDAKTIWWEVVLTTAAHVVFDDIEAKHTTCKLFYDQTDSDVKIFDKFSLLYVDVNKDACALKFITCDETLGKELYALARRRAELLEKVNSLYANRVNDKWNFIVSYPHGCTKQVSVGKCLSNVKISDYLLSKDYYYSRMTYNTCTCPGSSGAWIHLVGCPGAHVHRGADLQTGINFSSVGLYFREESP